MHSSESQLRNTLIIVGVIATVTLGLSLAAAFTIGSVAETSRELARTGTAHPAYPGPTPEQVRTWSIEELQEFVLDDIALIQQLTDYIEVLAHGYEELRDALLYVAAINLVLIFVVVMIRLRRFPGSLDAA